MYEQRRHIDSVDTPHHSAEGEHVEEINYDPYAERRMITFKVNQWIYLVFGVIEFLLALRFVFRLLDANPNAPFGALVYGVTAPFLLPLSGCLQSRSLMAASWRFIL